ncbi:hypothetical protein NLU14_10675 [Marinobacter sp. 71-i]|uniref:HNH endonuclease n=1 Tax=Marinobacter iranensis TaxID=2962607 RepID=A0ABT5YAI1_9GAMM|nr:hypothetical protein [Marinobacter iranensis]MDF0750693.1 hypothetical protein [Marinobacter iranensis]
MDPSDEMPAQFRGEVAHIVGERPDGPRGESELPLQQRNHESNLVLLCFNHHNEIDGNVQQYPVNRLYSIKAAHKSWVTDRLTLEAPWQTTLHNFYYLNVPRLQVLSAISGASLDLSRYGQVVALHEMGWELGGLMAGFQQLLEQVELKAIPMRNALSLGSDARGLIVSFDDRFRTKNITMPQTTEEYRTAVRGDLQTDPQIYLRANERKITMVVDPRWITTTTAFVQFRPSGGQNQFAGLGLVNAVGDDSMSITPLVIGLPSNPFMEALYSNA